MTVLTINTSFATVDTVSFKMGQTPGYTVSFVSGDTIRFFNDSIFAINFIAINNSTISMLNIPKGSSFDYTVSLSPNTTYTYMIVKIQGGGSYNSTGSLISNNIIPTAISSHTITNVDFTIKAFPNPCVDVLKIVTPVDAVLNILTIDGQLAMTSNIVEGSNQIDVSSLSNGIYFVSVRNKTIRIIKQ